MSIKHLILALIILAPLVVAAPLTTPQNMVRNLSFIEPGIGVVNASFLCIGSDCRTEWPTGGGAGVTIQSGDSYIVVENGTVTNISASLSAFDARYALLSVISGLYSNVTTLQSTSSSQATSITNLQVGLGTVNSSLLNQIVRIDTLNTTSASYNTSITNLQIRANTFNTSIGLLSTNDSNANTSITNLQTRANTLNTTTINQGVAISTLNTSVISYNASITNLQQRANTLNTTVQIGRAHV
jgi:hypothetical protein